MSDLSCPKCKERFQAGEDLCVHLVQIHQWNILAAAQFAHAVTDS